MVIDHLDSVIARLKREAAYHDDRLKLIFAVIYRKPDEAYRKWQRIEQTRGFDRAYRRLIDKPKSMGRLKGSLILGFIKSEARKNAELSMGELQFHAKKSHIIKLQLEEAIAQNDVARKAQAEERKQDMKQVREAVSNKTTSIMQARQ